MRTTITFAVTILALLFNAGAAFAEDVAGAADSGVPFEEKVAACAACHGENGAAPILPEYPILAGQYASYLEVSLAAYRDGDRNNAIMAGFAAGLSDEDIAALADYFAGQSGLGDRAPE